MPSEDQNLQVFANNLRNLQYQIKYHDIIFFIKSF